LPRTDGRQPIQRFAAGLADLDVLLIGFDTAPIVARHSPLDLAALHPKRAQQCKALILADQLHERAGERASWPPRPGLISILWMIVPTGMLRIGSVLPGLMSNAFSPDNDLIADR